MPSPNTFDSNARRRLHVWSQLGHKIAGLMRPRIVGVPSPADLGLRPNGDAKLAELQAAREAILDDLHVAANRGFIPDAHLWTLHQNRHNEADLHLAECIEDRAQAVADERAHCEQLFALLDQPEPVAKWRVIEGLGTTGGMRRSAANG